MQCVNPSPGDHGTRTPRSQGHELATAFVWSKWAQTPAARQQGAAEKLRTSREWHYGRGWAAYMTALTCAMASKPLDVLPHTMAAPCWKSMQVARPSPMCTPSCEVTPLPEKCMRRSQPSVRAKPRQGRPGSPCGLHLRSKMPACQGYPSINCPLGALYSQGLCCWLLPGRSWEPRSSS